MHKKYSHQLTQMIKLLTKNVPTKEWLEWKSTRARTLLGWLVKGEIVSTFSGPGNLREKQSHSQVNLRADKSQCVYNPKFLHLTLENASKDESSPGTIKTTLTLTRGCQTTTSLNGWVWLVVSDRCDVFRWSGCWHHLERNKMDLHLNQASTGTPVPNRRSVWVRTVLIYCGTFPWLPKKNCRGTRANYFALRQTNRWTDIIDYYCDRFIWEI